MIFLQQKLLINYIFLLPILILSNMKVKVKLWVHVKT